MRVQISPPLHVVKDLKEHNMLYTTAIFVCLIFFALAKMRRKQKRSKHESLEPIKNVRFLRGMKEEERQ